MYDPSSGDKRDWLKIVADQTPYEPMTGPLSIEFMFVFCRPKSHFRTGRHAGQLRPKAPQFMTRTPDIDNLVKFYMDAMNGKFFEDDRQICDLTARKRYADVGESQSVHIVMQGLEVPVAPVAPVVQKTVLDHCIESDSSEDL